jgi:intracellular sulfur oxidation DsrE/DsrF family protein
VETLTESDDKSVTLKIQEHVASMHKRVKEKRGLRFWDELFVVLFRNADKITMKVENTPNGVKVLETSDDAYTVKLIQLHATVVSKFVKYGFDEAHKEHPAPAKGDSASKLVTPIIEGYGGVLALPDAVEQPRKGAKIIFDITAGDTDTGLNKGVERVARLLNLYGAAGMKASDVTIVMVLHGEATTAIMTEKAYAAKHPGKKNTSLPAIQALQKAGVKVLVCGQALGYKQVNRADVAPNIGVAAAALTVIMNKQDEGFSYVPVH